MPNGVKWRYGCLLFVSHAYLLVKDVEVETLICHFCCNDTLLFKKGQGGYRGVTVFLMWKKHNKMMRMPQSPSGIATS